MDSRETGFHFFRPELPTPSCCRICSARIQSLRCLRFRQHPGPYATLRRTLMIFSSLNFFLVKSDRIAQGFLSVFRCVKSIKPCEMLRSGVKTDADQAIRRKTQAHQVSRQTTQQNSGIAHQQHRTASPETRSHNCTAVAGKWSCSSNGSSSIERTNQGVLRVVHTSMKSAHFT